MEIRESKTVKPETKLRLTTQVAMTKKKVYVLAFILSAFSLFVYGTWEVNFSEQLFMSKTTEVDVTRSSIGTSSHATQNTTLKSTVTPGKQQVISVTQLETILLKECDGISTNHNMLLIKPGGNSKVLSYDEYRIWQADDFIKRKANPGAKSKAPQKLRKYTEAERPNAKTLLKNWNEKIDPDAIAADVANQRLELLKKGDDDILKIPEVHEEVFNSSYKVPNIIHYIWFGCNRFRVDHYITILGALKYQNPRLILIHGDCSPSGEYWDHLKKQGGDKIRLIKRTPPEKIWGIPIKVVEHRADVARLQLMLEVGGIYLDTDSAILRSVDELRNYSMLLSESNYNSLANGIIFANREAWFLRRWYHEYKYFKDNQWGHNSVIVPWALWRIFLEKIHVVKELICRPNWQELKMIYHELYDWHQNYVMHLYSRFVKEMDKTDEHTLKELSILNTTYGEIARYILWGDEKARNITDWIVSCNQTQGLDV